MYTLCTYFDKNYLCQGLTLYESLSRQADDFVLWVLCLDDASFLILDKLNLPNVKLVEEKDLTEFDPELLVAKGNRPVLEYYYCFTATLIRFVFNKNKETESVSYIDADMYFFSSLSSVLLEQEDRDIMIIEHRLLFAEKNYHGHFNVCLIYFKRNKNGLECLDWWARMTLISTKLTGDVFGDQRYLDEFPIRFQGVYIIPDLGVGTAPWNVGLYNIRKNKDQIMINNDQLKVYHYARFIMINDLLFMPTRKYYIDLYILKLIYKPYMISMRNSFQKIKSIDRDFSIEFTRHNLRGIFLGINLGRLFLLFKNNIYRVGLHIPIGYDKNIQSEPYIIPSRQDMEGIISSIIPKKYILSIAQLPPPVHGASLMNNIVIQSEVIRQKFQMEVINLHFSESISNLSAFSWYKLKTVFKYANRILKAILKKKPDLVYFTLSASGYAFYRDLLYVIIIKLFRIKILFHLHGRGFYKAGSKSWLAKKFQQYIFKNQYVIILDKNLVSDLKDIINTEPFVVPNTSPIPMKSFSILKRIPDKEIADILFVSNFIKEKGILDLINAVNILKTAGYKFKVKLVGAQSDISQEFLESYIRQNNLEDVINVLGPLFDDKKIAEYSNSDIFVFPTYYKTEAFPLVILEAMQFGLPVISTFEAAIPSIIDDGVTGFLVTSRHPELLAKKIEILINDPGLAKKMGEAGREKFLKKYSMDIFEQNMLEIFEILSADK